MIEIVVNQKNKEGVRYSFDSGTITIGRGQDNDIHLSSSTVSDNHARISLFENNCLIQRLVPTDSLLVNDEEVQRTHLYDQDVIRLGPYKLTVLSEGLSRSDDTMTADAAEAANVPVDSDRHSNPETETAPAATISDTAKTDPDRPSAAVTGEPGEDRPPSPPTLLSTGIDVLTGPAHGKRICFTGQSAKLGIKDETVVVIRPLQGGYIVFELNKYLVVTLNGKPMQEKPTPLVDGDLIEYANIRSRFFVEPG